jgi:hypothetical protein
MPNIPSDVCSETMSAAGGAGSVITASEIKVPLEVTLKHAARIAIEQDKPIMLDYYVDTHEGKAFLGEDSGTKEKMLVRSEEEYTSLIQKLFRVGDDKSGYDFIVITENSVYIVAGSTKKKTISVPSSA